MTTTILPTTAVPVWLFSQNADGTLSPASAVGGGVTSINTLTGAITLAAGSNITITPAGNTLTIAATSGAPSFSAITSGANTTAAMVVGTGASLASVPEFDIGASGTAGVLGLKGSTSGTATLTAPAIAGTTTNAIVSSNNISAPAFVSTVSTGTAPFTVASTTNVANLNASSLGGATFAAPGSIGSGTAADGTFTSLTSSGILTNSANGALSASAVYISGTPITGGSGTTTFPLVYIDNGASKPTTFSANGTMFGINAPNGFTGMLMSMYVNGSGPKISVDQNGSLSIGSVVSSGSVTCAAGSALVVSGHSAIRSAADGRITLNNNANSSGGLTRCTFGTEAAANPAFSFDGTTATITACDGAGTAANGIFNCALYKSGGVSGVTQTAEAVGTLATTGGIVTTFTAVSDERLKNHQPYNGGLKEISAITPIRYRWNEEGQKQSGQKGDRDYIGFSAQNAQKSIPETIQSITKDGYLSFEDRPIIAALVNAVKELAVKVHQLEGK